MLYLWPSFWLNAHFVRDPLSLTFRMPCEQKVSVSAFVLLTSDLVCYKTYKTQLRYFQKLDFEADPINKLKPLIKNYLFRFQNQLNFPYITQLKYGQKFVFEACPKDKLKALILKTKHFRTDPNNKHPRVDKSLLLGGTTHKC